METLSFRSNGKLLLSGEYLVLFGAEALAIPLRYGQTLDITVNDYPILAFVTGVMSAVAAIMVEGLLYVLFKVAGLF